MKRLTLLVLLLAGCAKTDFYEQTHYAEGTWAASFASLGCEQPVDGLTDRIAATDQFKDYLGWKRLDPNPPGSPERAQYLSVVSGFYYNEAISAGAVELSPDGSKAKLTVGDCAA